MSTMHSVAFKNKQSRTHLTTVGITNLMDILIHCVRHVKVNHQSDVD